MEIIWLEDFLVLSKTLNFSRAAEIRNLTQPAFSRRIQKLEQWLGVTLVDRSTYPAALTPDGERFKDVAKDVLRTFSDERDFCQQSALASKNAFVSFSMVHTIALSIFPQWILDLETHVGPLQTRVVNSSTQDCVEALIGGNVDFFLSFVHPSCPLLLDEQQYPSLMLGSEKLVPVSATDDSGRPRFCLDDPGDLALPYLECGPNTITFKMVETILQGQKRRPELQVCHRNTMSAALKALTISGCGLTWLPECLVKDEIVKGTLALAGSDIWTASMDLRIYRSHKATSEEKEAIWTYCAQRAEFSSYTVCA